MRVEMELSADCSLAFAPSSNPDCTRDDVDDRV